MARVRDWVELGKDTISSLKTSDVATLYGSEWPSTRKMLIAEHAGDIEREPRRIKRFVRTRSAILFGIAKRLAPLRRLIFLVAFVWFFACLFTVFAATHHKIDWWLFVEIAASFILMILLRSAFDYQYVNTASIKTIESFIATENRGIPLKP